ncbi:hypothetical protein FXF51_46050 [Nonomuraea sp. PA05]|uniref:hypothetical protein n=1 Tax=Nonomuraea sp. PA05 TaxID=2604466 RepID=UPI0011D7FDBE|nr:hypothetical protein [Nonomuraea sp. PA05]TYB55037.1 hypothetical protein FXF51_46050 [Nonomuraea sp. PA05]
MTWLRDVLVDLAEDSPRVDLAERTIMIRDRRRRTAISLVAAAMVVVTALGATLAARLLPPGPDDAASVTDLPAKGVGPLSHAVKTYCTPKSGPAPEDCQDGEWRLVTRDGRTYRVPDALPSLVPRRMGLRDSPLAISRDGGKIAYYGEEEDTFVVRDLASGRRTTAPAKVPKDWLYSMTRLMLSDDGRFLVFMKNPIFKDPGLIFDLRERAVRELPNGWVPAGLSPDGGTLTLSQYAPRSMLRTIPGLWTTPGDGTSVKLPQDYHFSPLAPDGRSIAVIENIFAGDHTCPRPGGLALLDSRTGEKLRSVTVRGMDAGVTSVSLRAWLGPEEVTVLTESVRCNTEAEDQEPDEEFDPPYRTMTAYAVNVETGRARKLATYTAQDFRQLVLPGAPGKL